jgi:NADH-quinone oxidoreductase subunit A
LEKSGDAVTIIGNIGGFGRSCTGSTAVNLRRKIMDQQSVPSQDLWLLAVYIAAALSLAAAVIGLSYVLGERHEGRDTGDPYESGLVPTGTAWLRFDVKYYLVAMFFVIFDLEAVFIFAWAAAVRGAGWNGYLAVAVFIAVLVAALFYLQGIGALDWRTLKQGRRG